MKNNSTIQAIILAGGLGSRLYPLTKNTPKPLLPIGGKPMILYVIDQLISADVRDLIISVREEQVPIYEDFFNSLNYPNINSLKVAVDSPETIGLPGAIAATQPFLVAEKFVVTCADVIIEESIKQAIKDFTQQSSGARMLGLKTTDTAGFSPIDIKADKVQSIHPKDKTKHSPGIIDSGTYMFHQDVFDKIKTLKPSEKGETAIWDLNQLYINQGELYISSVDGWWSDVGNSLETYAEVNKRYENK